MILILPHHMALLLILFNTTTILAFLRCGTLIYVYVYVCVLLRTLSLRLPAFTLRTFVPQIAVCYVVAHFTLYLCEHT